ncbi:MAG: sn-glycerol-3-phosphate import ATP-binding protein UgpC [Rhodospirillaceae bacterium]
MADIQMRDLRKTYAGGVEAIKGVSLDVEDGAFVVLVGPSGCGKSTLLRMVAGLESVTSGSIHIGGRQVDRLEPMDRDIAMVFQNYALYPHMSCRDNMAYGLRNRKMDKAEIASRVQEAAKILELESLLDRRPRQLSGGQRQRVAMGRAIVRRPAAFLFDEPLSNLDAKLRVQMRLEIRRLQRSLGTTSLYVTHDQVEAMTMADVLVVMNGGVAEQIGAPMEVYRRPVSTFVAGFIGSPAMNMLPVRAIEGGQIDLGGTTIGLPQDGPNVGSELGPEVGQPLTLGLRPEHLRLDGSGALRLAVQVVEPLGADILVHGAIEAAEGPSAMTLRLPAETRVAEGSVLPLSIDPADLHVFDPDSGLRI